MVAAISAWQHYKDTHAQPCTPHAHPLLYSVVHAHTLTGKGDVQSDSTHAHSSISAAFPSVMVNNYTHRPTHTHSDNHSHTYMCPDKNVHTHKDSPAWLVLCPPHEEPGPPAAPNMRGGGTVLHWSEGPERWGSDAWGDKTERKQQTLEIFNRLLGAINTTVRLYKASVTG